MRLSFAALVLVAPLITGCTTMRQTDPQRTATEQLLISTAADRAAEQLNFAIPKSDKVFVDASNFEGYDSKYAISAIRDHILRQGYQLMADKNAADAVIEIRSGALSTDDKKILVGIPSFDLPVPLAGSTFTFPEIALYKREEIKGVAKFAATAYGAKDGRLLDSISPQFGGSQQRKTLILFLISWSSDDLRQAPAPSKAANVPYHQVKRSPGA